MNINHSPEGRGVGIVAPGTSWESGPAIERFQAGLRDLGIFSQVFNEDRGDPKYIQLAAAISHKQMTVASEDPKIVTMEGLAVINYSFAHEQELAPDDSTLLAIKIAARLNSQIFLSKAVLLDEFGITALNPQPKPIIFSDEQGPDLTAISNNLQLVGVA